MKRLCVCMVIMLYAATAHAFNTDLWQAPQLPDSQLIYKDKPVEVMHIKVQVTHLRTKASQEGVFSFYKGELERTGWRSEKMLSDMVLTFMKDGRYLYVGVAGGVSGQEVYLVSSPESLSICPIVKEHILRSGLAVDAPGKDVADIPRFPTAKRRFDIVGPVAGAVLLYETTSSPDEVMRFYRKAMPEAGWKELRNFSLSFLQGIDMLMKDYSFSMFDKDSDHVMLAVFKVPDKLMKNSEDMPKGRSLIFITRNAEQEFFDTEKGE